MWTSLSTLKLFWCIDKESVDAVDGRLGEAPLETVMNASEGFSWEEASLDLEGVGTLLFVMFQQLVIEWLGW